jgi:hypothetical protein
MSSPKYNDDKSLRSAFDVLTHCKKRLELAYQKFLENDEETARAIIAGVFVLYNEEFAGNEKFDGLAEYLDPRKSKYLPALGKYTKDILDDFRKESKKN